MSRRRKAKVRILLSGFSSRLGSETLNVRIYRDREAFVCERELVERDGTSFTMVLPLRSPEDAQGVLKADPYYPRVKHEVGMALSRLEKALLQEQDGKRAA